jgi:hypothetical protein
MPIEGYDEIERLYRLGFVRRGYQEQVLGDNGTPELDAKGRPKTKPVATPYFIVPPEVQEVLGEEKPTRLPIYFLLEIEKALPHYLMRYSGNGKLRCAGDGVSVRYRKYINATEKRFYTVIYNGVARWKEISPAMLSSWESEYSTTERYGGEAGNTMRCLHWDCKQFKRGYCKPTGLFKFGIQGIPEQGYYQMTIHDYALKPTLSQLRWARDIVAAHLGEATIIGPKFALTMKGPEKVSIKGKLTTVWLPLLQLEQHWLDMAMSGRVRLPGRPQIRVTDIYGTNGVPQLPGADEEADVPPEVLEDRQYETDDEGDEEQVEDEGSDGSGGET